jgi:uncharacterized membrane protein YgdD (TMEM256/DUF423 family)
MISLFGEKYMERIFVAIGALSAFMGVGAGAFGAHALKGRLTPDVLAVFEVGVRYQMYHAFGLFVAAWVCTRWPGTFTNLAGWFFFAGTVIFSGSLYALSLTGLRWMGAITPFGGISFLAGWLMLAWGVLRS